MTIAKKIGAQCVWLLAAMFVAACSGGENPFTAGPTTGVDGAFSDAAVGAQDGGDPSLLGVWTRSENRTGLTFEARLTLSGTPAEGTLRVDVVGIGVSSPYVGCMANGGGTGTWTWLAPGQLRMVTSSSTTTWRGCENPQLNISQTAPPTTSMVAYRVQSNTLSIDVMGSPTQVFTRVR